MRHDDAFLAENASWYVHGMTTDRLSTRTTEMIEVTTDGRPNMPADYRRRCATERVSVVLPAALAEALRQVAKDTGRSLNEVIRRAIVAAHPVRTPRVKRGRPGKRMPTPTVKYKE